MDNLTTKNLKGKVIREIRGREQDGETFIIFEDDTAIMIRELSDSFDCPIWHLDIMYTENWRRGPKGSFEKYSTQI